MHTPFSIMMSCNNVETVSQTEQQSYSGSEFLARLAQEAESVPLAPKPLTAADFAAMLRQKDFLLAAMELPFHFSELPKFFTQKMTPDRIEVSNRFYGLPVEPVRREKRRSWEDAPEEERNFLVLSRPELYFWPERPQSASDTENLCKKGTSCPNLSVCDVCCGCLDHAAIRTCCQPEKIATIQCRRRGTRVSRGLSAFFRRQLKLSVERRETARARAKLRKAFEKLTGPAQRFFGFDIGGIPDKIEHVIQMPQIGEFINTLVGVRGDVNWLKLITEGCFFFAHLAQGGFTTGNLLLSATHFLTSVGLSDMLSIFEKITRRVPNVQSGSGPAGVLGAAIAGAIALVSMLLFSAMPASKDIDQFINRFSRLGHCINSFNKVTEVSEKMADYVVEFVKTTLLGYSSSDLKEFEAIDKFCDEVQAVNRPNLSEVCANDTQGVLRQKVTTWLQQADDICRQLDALRLPQTATGRFRSTHLFLFKLRDMLNDTPAGIQQSRIAPITVHIHGTTGVGKSSTLDYLNTHLLIALGSTEPTDLQNKVYYRNPAAEHWDGFKTGTQIVICDDFGSVRDTPSRPSTEGIDLIRASNTAPFKPTMADLTGKAVAVFEAPVIILTSNRASFEFKSMTNPEAVMNRINLRFRQFPHPDFACSKVIHGTPVVTLDQAKVEEAAKTDPSVYRKCMIFVQESVEGLPSTNSGSYDALSKPMTFDEMKDLCVAALKRKQAHGQKVRQDRLDYFKSVLSGEAQAGCGACANPSAGCHVRFDDGATDEPREHIEKCGPGVLPSSVIEADLVAQFLDEHVATKVKHADDVRNNDATAVSPEEARRLRAAGYVHVEMKTFVRPSFVGRMMGQQTHIDVYNTLLTNGFNPRKTKLRYCGATSEVDAPMDENMEKFFKQSCITCMPGDERKVVGFIIDMYSLLAGDYTNVNMTALADQWAIADEIFFRYCECHRDAGAEEAVWHRVLRSLYETIDTPLIALAKVELKTAKRFPIISVIWQLLKIGFVIWAIRAALRWFCGVIYRTVSAAFSMVREGCGRMSDLIYGREMNTEAYPSGTARAAPRGHVETYPGGTIRTTPAGHVEVHGNGTVTVSPSKTDKGAFVVKADVEAYPSGAVKSTPGGRVEGLSGDAQSISDQNAMEVRRKVVKNLYHIWTRETSFDQWVPVGSLLIIRGRIAITNRHIFAALDKHVKIVSSVVSRLCFEFSKDNMNMAFVEDASETYGNRDVCMVELPAGVSIHADLTSHFMTSFDYSHHEELSRVSLVKYSDVSGESVCHFIETDRCIADTQQVFTLRDANGNKAVRRFYMYKMETTGGDCGGVLISFDKRFNRKIVAIHMAGLDDNHSGFTAVGTAVSQNMLKELRTRLQLRLSHSDLDGYVNIPNPVEVKAEGGRMTSQSRKNFDGLHYHGSVDSPVFAATETAIRPSPVHEICGPVLKKPAYLRRSQNMNGEIVDPLPTAMKKVATPSLLMPAEELEMATKHVKAMICENGISDAKTLTFGEAIAGVAGDAAYPSINRSTSPGYGWKKVGLGKQHYLGTDDFVVLPEVKSKYDEIHDGLKNGKRSGQLWTDTLKDEIRPIEKVEAGKTRLFSAGEMVQTILLRQYFMGFNAHMARHYIDFESCVGINPYSMDWTKLANRLRKFGINVVAGDFANYDGTLPADGLWKVLEVVNAFYSQSPSEEDNNRIRELLWLEIVNSVHVQGAEVYSWTHSQPSGCPFTSILNSVFHSIAVRVAYLLCAKKYAPESATLACFDKFVAHINYGDDDVTNVSSEADWFNQITMAEAYATFGMTYTDETKTGELVKFKTLEQIQFLKRAFVWDVDQARWFAPLELNTIREMPCWNKTKGDSLHLTGLVLEDAVYELAQHPKVIFDAEIVRLERAARLVRGEGVQVYLPMFSEIRRVDLYKYMVGLKVKSEPINPCDRDILAIAERQDVANPAAVACHLFEGYDKYEGELFNSSGGCVPSQNNRLFTRRTCAGNESDLHVESGLNNNKQNFTEFLESCPERKPTMCHESAFWKDPDVLKHYMIDYDACRIEDGAICDFHCRHDIEILRELHLEFTSGVGLSGPAQSGKSDVIPFVGEPSTEEHEIMTFEHDGDTEDAERAPSSATPAFLTNPVEDSLTNDIVGFLKRPFHLRDFEWTLEHPIGHQLVIANLPRNWLQQKMIAEKLSGFRYLRCTLVVEVQVNAQPMNAGALIGYFVPLREQLTDVMSNEAHFGGIMGYPHVIYRCDQTSTFRMRIPFFPLLAGFDLVNGYGAMGTFLVKVMSGLTGADNVDGSVFVWAEDVVTSLPTGMLSQATTLSGPSQSGAKKEREQPGNVETAAKTLGGIADSLSALPVVGDFAKMGSAVLNGVGKVAQMFGFSKPSDPEFVTMVQPVVGRHMANFNGDSKPKMLALDAQNVINIATEAFNTTEDEMAFNLIVRRPVYTDRFTYKSETAQGTQIFAWPVDAGSCVKTRRAVPGTEPPVKIIDRRETYLSYLSTCASQWRGGICYRFMFVKTDFHSGRLRFTYVPGAQLTTKLTDVDINKCYSEVHDIRNTSDVEFTIPYNYIQAWKLCGPVKGVADTLGVPPQGMLYVSVVNALRCPATVEPKVDVLMMTSGADDFQFAIPHHSPGLQVWTAASRAPATLTGQAQSGKPMFVVKTDGVEVNANTVGETFTGFRQMLKRYVQFGPSGSVTFTPYVFQDGRQTVEGDMARIADPMYKAALLYRFMSGSMRLLLARENMTSLVTSMAATQGAGHLDGGAICVNTTVEPIVEVAVPFYQKFSALVTDIGAPGISEPEVPSPGLYFTSLPCNRGTTVTISPEAKTDDIFFRAIGEDFSFGYLMGVPLTFVKDE